MRQFFHITFVTLHSKIFHDPAMASTRYSLTYAITNNVDEEKVFQSNIDSLHAWSILNKMPFNTKKCKFIVFGKQEHLPTYSIGGHKLECVEETKYLGVTMQSNLKFNTHISNQINKANKILGCIKYTIHEAPKHAKLLAYTSLCRPLLDYADVLWDPADTTTTDQLELVQNKAIRFILGIKGRRGVTEGRTNLELPTLKERRRNHRISLLMRILSDENNNKTLSTAYEEIVNSRAQTSMMTRAAERGEPTSIYASSHLYHNSFLPRSIRDLRIGSQPVIQD